MGSIIKARCDCGFSQAELYLGGGMRTFQEECLFPVLCMKCHSLSIANLLEKDICCPKCDESDVKPYDLPALSDRKGKIIFEWNTDRIGRTLTLTEGEYLCPKCGKFSMHFYEVGNWD
jgi:hypothetical protein